ncbi:L-galactono-1,4-lactone dehydrogenase, mitochondrial [Rutidosis leptorrhynchoides]|uniref:L-galactono-1,4-lactone dehydrogenase, mitochondrial n=1 Tax=Rutidosis leptorrhynchoides TaxID=125765 RepID=UPI003A99747E
MLRSLRVKRSLQSLNQLINPQVRHLSTPPPPPPPIPPPLSAAAASSTSSETRKYLGYSALLLACAVGTYFSFPLPENAKHKKAQLFRYAPLPDDLHTVVNWSGTHEVQTKVFLQPESLEELENIVKDANEKKQKIRPIGSGLSPNGIGLARNGMVNMGLLDKVLEVDKEKKTVRVEAGIRVQKLVDEIKEFGITLQNFASIREQQVGGIIQVGAHGTGAKLPPIDEQVISMKLVTPGKGTIVISKDKDPELFNLARCGLGALGVVAEVTLQCVERQELIEHTFVSNLAEIKKKHKKFLNDNKHVKYLYIPYTDTVVVVTCNPASKWRGPPKFKPKYSLDEALQPIRDLYKESREKYRSQLTTASSTDENETKISDLTFTELRDKLISLDPLNKDHVRKVNEAEAEFWKRSEGYRVGWSDEILGFDCGGQQWVSETCFPAGTLSKPNMKDLKFVEDVVELIEKQEIPAPSPIEQRWTASSKSLMSPASSSANDDIFSWVGIIMYLPTSDSRQRKQITEEFFHYRHLTRTRLWDQYSAYEHWAKIEVPKDKNELAALQERLRKRFPVEEFNKARKELDPNRILSNNMVDKMFPLDE